VAQRFLHSTPRSLHQLADLCGETRGLASTTAIQRDECISSRPHIWQGREGSGRCTLRGIPGAGYRPGATLREPMSGLISALGEAVKVAKHRLGRARGSSCLNQDKGVSPLPKPSSSAR
jgi:hypothetical protein